MAVSKEIYVEGLPFDMQDSAVTELFSEAGTVVRSVIPRWHDSGRLRGYAILEFETEAEAQEALKLNKKQLDGGRYLSVTFSKGKKVDNKKPASSEMTADEQSTCLNMFVGNLPYDITEDDLNGLFSSYGPVQDIRVVSENGRTKGFAYIEYKKPGVVKRVVSDSEKKKFYLKGRALVVDFNSGNKRAGFHVRKDAYDSSYYKKKQNHVDKRKNIVKRV